MIDWDRKPYWIMGVVNITPDSFSDGGRFVLKDAALRHAERLVAEGADIIDIGAESTRPNAPVISEEEELKRIVPILENIKSLVDVPISVDTSSSKVMQIAADLGVSMINDVRAFQRAGSLDFIQQHESLSVCVMHSQGEPQQMQNKPTYRDVVLEVEDFFTQRLASLSIHSKRILLDPGFGFGKTLVHNIALFRAIPRLADLGYPLLVGVSRKSMIGQITQQNIPADRLVGSVVAAVDAIHLGAKVVRVHDVAETVQGLKVSQALRG